MKDFPDVMCFREKIVMRYVGNQTHEQEVEVIGINKFIEDSVTVKIVDGIGRVDHWAVSFDDIEAIHPSE